ncbi:MAG: hypothetical protein HZB39_15210 [Planctomycetes bacterium]|nr:hypothetical protein [Planctomycetota bacterium]
MAGLGVGLFVSALAGTLAVQGRLDGDGIKSLPVIAWFTGGAEVEPGADDPQERGTKPLPKTATRQDPGANAAAEIPGLFAVPKLPSGITEDDVDRMLQAAKAAREAAEQERALVGAESRSLETRQRDIEDRESAIAQAMLKVDSEREKLERRIEEFERQVLLVQRDEIRALREYGRSLAAFAPERAAAIVEKEWDSDAGRKRIVRVLTLMEPADADAVLAAMPDERLREVLLERLKVVVETRDR